MAEISSIYGLDVETIKKLQTKIGVKADGMIGKQTATALQAFLNQNGANLTVDGVIGKKTIQALQEYAGVTADGAFGPNSAQALTLKLMENESGERIASTEADVEAIFQQQFKDAGLA